MPSTSVLLVDDEVPFVQAMTRYLTKKNFDLATASDGAEALDVINHRNDVDVVILDVRMPGMDGITALQQIKKDHPLIQVIVLTGYVTVESAMRGKKLGAFDYMMKPCNVKELLEKVQEAKAYKSRLEEDLGRHAHQSVSS